MHTGLFRAKKYLGLARCLLIDFILLLPMPGARLDIDPHSRQGRRDSRQHLAWPDSWDVRPRSGQVKRMLPQQRPMQPLGQQQVLALIQHLLTQILAQIDLLCTSSAELHQYILCQILKALSHLRACPVLVYSW